MTVFDPSSNRTTPSAPGLWGWVSKLIRGWLAPSPVEPSAPLSAAGIAARATGLGGEDGQGAYVVAPGGYRIRVPQPDAVNTKVGQMLPSVRKGMELVPPLPHVVAELLREVQDANATAASVAAIAANDPSLSAGLLRTVNSAAFGLTRKVTAVSEAVSYIGFTSVRSMVLRLQLDNALTGSAAASADPATLADVEDVWAHSLIVSYVADELCKRVVGVDGGFAATLGLLHDLGKLVVLSRFSDEAARLRTAPLNPTEPQLEREARVLGVDHAALGANLAGRWGLPGDLVRAIRWHHNPPRAFEPSDPKPLHQAVAVVQVANQLAKYLYVYQDRTELDAIASSTLDLLGLGRDVPALLTADVRAAATRAILFADEGTQRPVSAVRRFLRLNRGEQAAVLVSAAATPAARHQVEVDDVLPDALFATDDGVLRATATPAGVAHLARDVARAQAALPLAATARPTVSILTRLLLANVAAGGADGDVVEVVQSVADGRAQVAVRCPAFDFARRFGPGVDVDAAVAVVDTEWANVLNLGWCESISVSSDGSTFVFTVAG